MAERMLILSEPLCFLFGKFGKCPVKVLKTAVIDFFDIESIIAAKKQLLEDVRQLNLDEKQPHIPAQRTGEARLTREVDDILQLMVFLDEHKHSKKLPKYVSEGPDNLPATKLFDGDLKFLFARMEKLEEKLEHSSSLAAIGHRVDCCRRNTFV